MARFEIELGTTGEKKLKDGLKGVNDEMSSLQSSLAKLSSNLEKANANSLGLEKELVSLNKQLASGSISSKQFAKDQLEITTALASSRQSAIGYQAQINSINATLKNGVTSLDNYGNSVKKLAGYHSDYSRGIRGASGVSLEFARIIQDAPYGINGIANNIQQLTSNYQTYAKNLREAAAAQGQTISSFGIFKSAVGSLVSPLSLVTLGVSLATAGFTAYTMWQQRSAKATKENQGATKSYAETLTGVTRAQVEGNQNAQKDLTNLRLLYAAYQNANLPLKTRRDAYRQIQQEYPEYFKNIAFEQKASNATVLAYNSLTTSILATARARAASNLITQSSTRQLENESKAAKLQVQIDKERLILSQQINKIRKDEQRGGLAAGSAGVGAAQGQGLATIREQGEVRINKLLSERNNLNTDTRLINTENLKLQDLINKEIARGGKLIDINNSKDAKVKSKKAPIDRSASIITRSDASESLFGLTGVDREVESVRQEFIKLYSDLDANAKKSVEARKSYESDYAKLQANEASKITTIIVAENSRRENEIERIRTEAGIKSSETLAKELLEIEKSYNTEIIKARDNANIIAVIEEAKQSKILAATNKYINKRLDAEQKILSKITDVTDKAFTKNINNTARGTDIIDRQLQDRLSKLRKYFDELRKTNVNGVLGLIAIGATQKAATDKAKTDADNAKNPVSERLKEQLTDAVVDFGRDFTSILRNINNEADRSLGAILKNVGVSLQNILRNAFDSQLKTILTNLIKDFKISAKDAGVAIAGIGGAFISGSTRKTNTLGQAAGGALTGAAVGFATAGPIGAAIGGLAGAIGGIFGASKAKKEEAVQKAQLAEQKKQTKLLERQNALAYQSSIIGQATSKGVITGVERNEFGELKTKISGSDIWVVWEKEGKSRQRGL